MDTIGLLDSVIATYQKIYEVNDSVFIVIFSPSVPVNDNNNIWSIDGMITHQIEETDAMNNYMVYLILSILSILITGTAIADPSDKIVVGPIQPIHVAPGESFSVNVTLNNTGNRLLTSTIKFDKVPDCINKLDKSCPSKKIPKGRSDIFNTWFKADAGAKEGKYILKVSDNTGGIGDPDTWTDIIILVETKTVPTPLIQAPTSTPIHMATPHQRYTEKPTSKPNTEMASAPKIIDDIFIISLLFILYLFFTYDVIKKRMKKKR